MFFSPGGSSFNMVIAYIENVERFSNEMKYLYKLALKNGFNEEAEEVYASIRDALADLSKEAKERADSLMAEWAIQEDLGKIIHSQEIDATVSEALVNRFEVDTRNFFSPSIIADTARELSGRADLHNLSGRVFEISIKKMAAIRGEKDNFSRDVVSAIKDSSLTDNEKDEVLLTLIQEMVPKEKHPLTKYFNMQGDLTESALFFKELLSEEKYPRAKEYLLSRIGDSVLDLEPKRYGERLEGEYGFSQFNNELNALAYITGCFRERREVANPSNFKGLISLYPAPEEALLELEELFPDLVKKEMAKTKATSLPSVTDIEKGNFDPEILKDILPSLLQPSQPEDVWREAFSALEAWLRYDVLTILSQKEMEEKKKWDEKKDVYIDVPDLESRRKILEVHLRKTPLASNVKVDELVKETEGYVGADLEALVREAAMCALRRDMNCKEVSKGDFEEAFSRVKPSVSAETAKRYKKIEEYYIKQAKAGLEVGPLYAG